MRLTRRLLLRSTSFDFALHAASILQSMRAHLDYSMGVIIKTALAEVNSAEMLELTYMRLASLLLGLEIFDPVMIEIERTATQKLAQLTGNDEYLSKKLFGKFIAYATDAHRAYCCRFRSSRMPLWRFSFDHCRLCRDNTE